MGTLYSMNYHSIVTPDGAEKRTVLTLWHISIPSIAHHSEHRSAPWRKQAHHFWAEWTRRVAQRVLTCRPLAEGEDGCPVPAELPAGFHHRHSHRHPHPVSSSSSSPSSSSSSLSSSSSSSSISLSWWPPGGVKDAWSRTPPASPWGTLRQLEE